ncbi:hypothetical protein PHMEG_00010364, partial [Phytophthora megakarya]
SIEDILEAIQSLTTCGAEYFSNIGELVGKMVRFKNQCLSSKRAHFVLDKLDQTERDFIGERFGGLKPEVKSL